MYRLYQYNKLLIIATSKLIHCKLYCCLKSTCSLDRTILGMPSRFGKMPTNCKACLVTLLMAKWMFLWYKNMQFYNDKTVSKCPLQIQTVQLHCDAKACWSHQFRTVLLTDSWTTMACYNPIDLADCYGWGKRKDQRVSCGSGETFGSLSPRLKV